MVADVEQPLLLHNGDGEEAQARRLLALESVRFPWRTFLALTGLFAWLMASDLMKDVATCGSPAFWLLVLSVVPLVLAVMALTRRQLLFKGCVKEQVRATPPPPLASSAEPSRPFRHGSNSCLCMCAPRHACMCTPKTPLHRPLDVAAACASRPQRGLAAACTLYRHGQVPPGAPSVHQCPPVSTRCSQRLAAKLHLPFARIPAALQRLPAALHNHRRLRTACRIHCSTGCSRTPSGGVAAWCSKSWSPAEGPVVPQHPHALQPRAVSTSPRSNRQTLAHLAKHVARVCRQASRHTWETSRGPKRPRLCTL